MIFLGKWVINKAAENFSFTEFFIFKKTFTPILIMRSNYLVKEFTMRIMALWSRSGSLRIF